MSVPSHAIFPGYARDDAAAARRIAEALRNSELEVWFDENELREGDAWDARICKQINDCALFVPVISPHTQERNQGNFWLEWKLAVERNLLQTRGPEGKRTRFGANAGRAFIFSFLETARRSCRSVTRRRPPFP